MLGLRSIRLSKRGPDNLVPATYIQLIIAIIVSEDVAPIVSTGLPTVKFVDFLIGIHWLFVLSKEM